MNEFVSLVAPLTRSKFLMPIGIQAWQSSTKQAPPGLLRVRKAPERASGLFGFTEHKMVVFENSQKTF
jgi:hypothetical protein